MSMNLGYLSFQNFQKEKEKIFRQSLEEIRGKYKIGDKLVCKNNYLRKSKFFEKDKVYEIIDIYEDMISQRYLINVKCQEYLIGSVGPIDSHIVFDGVYMKFDDKKFYINNYFYTIKESRKLKLTKIKGNFFVKIVNILKQM